MNNLQIISGVKCYEENGNAYLRLEDVARGLGFITVATSGNEVVRWNTVHKYLSDLGVATSCNGSGFKDMCPEYIPENIFYRLAMKAKNETAEKFQALVADEIIPSIRRTGGYIAGQKELSPDELMAKALMVAQKTLADREAQISNLTVQNQIMAPKADYFDEIVDRNLLTNFRETAKQLGIGEKSFIAFLLEKKYIYRDKRGKLMPYAEKNTGLFEMKECFNEKTQWAGTQTLITPKGRETFRLLVK
ncbi:MAG: phage antirepressor KilAC domain-containing protein [Fournierella sp.]|uniref:phage antirepressor KilAC domain-containing protein n=1 Tax=Allofournierella sp. TaxID=1940256 RepID=UPI002A7F4E0E|nr:phage antirepressor KilAC domain-containing protein [Fournierella sp.]MDY4166111.1 phage antirepressor KilAC domain-containing protein [Fournierella sp.]